MRELLYFFTRSLIFIQDRWQQFLARYFYQIKAERKVAAFTPPLKINGKTLLTANTHLGKNVNFNGLIISGQGKVEIGDNFHSGVECRIIAQNHNYQSEVSIPYDRTYIRKGVKIEDNVWIGDRVIILDGVTIGEGAIIQAGSVVVKSIPPCAIAGGHPAKVFSERNKDTYYRLKAEGKFF